MRRPALYFVLPLTFVAVLQVAWKQGSVARNQLFDRTEIMVSMRDGVRLQTAIFVPRQAERPLPFLLTRTPYGVPDNENGLADPNGPYSDLVREGYIFVVQNVRGRFQSEGQFVMQRPPRDKRDQKSIDEATDAYDTIEYLLANIPNNNGRVGMWGVSYSGWTTVMALTEPHPALKVVSEQAAAADMFLGDDFHHNGAFRLSYGLEYSAEVEAEKGANFHFEFDKYDTYEWYLALGVLSNVNDKYFHGKIPTWNNFVNHPNRDEFWKKQAVETFLHNTTVPNLNVAGWWDQEDFYGPIKVYDLLEKSDVNHINYLVVGPWNHGGWRGVGDHLGNISFGSKTGEYFRDKVLGPWFAYWLHDKGKLSEPEALTFQTGSNTWKTYDAWPPKDALPKKLYFQSGRQLRFEVPRETDAAAIDSYVSDPANPVPYRARPITPTYPGPEWPIWLTQDQRFVDHRPDVLSWETQPLKEDIGVAGDIVADIFASTSGSDSDWIVKLIDVLPEGPKGTNLEDTKQPDAIDVHLEGYQLIIADEVFRGRFRNGFERPEPVVPDRIVEYKIDLHTNNHCFKKGHKIMVQVQSTWFPLIDRNPQKFVPNIFKARDSDYVKATQRIFRSKRYPSSIILPMTN